MIYQSPAHSEGLFEECNESFGENEKEMRKNGVVTFDRSQSRWNLT